jgi:hypothetical protein
MSADRDLPRPAYDARRARDGSAVLCLRRGAPFPDKLSEADWEPPQKMLAPPAHIVQAIETTGYYLTGSSAAEASWDEAARSRPKPHEQVPEPMPNDQVHTELLGTTASEPANQEEEILPELALEQYRQAPRSAQPDKPAAEKARDDDGDEEFEKAASILQRVWGQRRSR